MEHRPRERGWKGCKEASQGAPQGEEVGATTEMYDCAAEEKQKNKMQVLPALSPSLSLSSLLESTRLSLRLRHSFKAGFRRFLY